MYQSNDHVLVLRLLRTEVICTIKTLRASDVCNFNRVLILRQWNISEGGPEREGGERTRGEGGIFDV